MGEHLMGNTRWGNTWKRKRLIGETADEATPNGEIPKWGTQNGETADGGIPNGESPDGDTSDVETLNGEISGAETPNRKQRPVTHPSSLKLLRRERDTIF